MPVFSSQPHLNRHPQSSRDLSLYTSEQLDQLRRSNATIRLTRWQSFKLFFWDPDSRAVCYRTGSSWLFILTFYPIFAALVILLFYFVMVLMVTCIKSYSSYPMITKDYVMLGPTWV